MTLYICPICKKQIRHHKDLSELAQHYDDASNFVSHVNSLILEFGRVKLIDNQIYRSEQK